MTAFTPVGQTVTAPTFTDSVDQQFFVEPLSGPADPTLYLDRFPDSIYNKSPDSHLVRFMYTLLGPAGVGWLRQNYLQVRLQLTEQGFETFDLEKYYANPFRFGRVLAEQFEEDPTGLLSREQWDKIKAQDEAYRSRVIEYFNAARAGTTPFGMELAARSGLGRNVEVVENYKALFDRHSDDPKGFDYIGQTLSASEFIVVPRLDVSRSEQQKIDITGSPTGGNFVLIFKGQVTSTLNINASAPSYPTAFDVQSALQALSSIGPDNVQVSGGPGEDGVGDLYFEPYVVTFRGALAGQNVPLIEAVNGMTGGVSPEIKITTIANGISANDEPVVIDPELQHNLQTALDFLKPINTIPTVYDGTGLRSTQPWKSVTASSEHYEVLRFVRGSTSVRWPTVSSLYWIESGIEKEAPRIREDHQQAYVGFQNVSNIVAYTDEVSINSSAYKQGTNVPWNTFNPETTSELVGPHSKAQNLALPLQFKKINPTERMTADRALADYAEPINVTTQDPSGNSLINGIYPARYASLQGVPTIKYKDDQFWASVERSEGTEFLEIDLGSAQPVNFISFEMVNKPFNVSIDYDVLDAAPRRRFVPVTPLIGTEFSTAFRYISDTTKPWTYVEYNFTDSIYQMPFTRFIRISFERALQQEVGSFLYDAATDTQLPFSVEVKNLRVGRNAN